MLEVSQLLTTVPSPVSPVEDYDADVALEGIRQPQRSAVGGADFHGREAVADLERFHITLECQNQAVAETSLRQAGAPLGRNQLTYTFAEIPANLSAAISSVSVRLQNANLVTFSPSFGSW